jgi:hypothetical protein
MDFIQGNLFSIVRLLYLMKSYHYFCDKHWLSMKKYIIELVTLKNFNGIKN